MQPAVLVTGGARRIGGAIASAFGHAGWHVVVATNQSGIGRGMIDMASVNAVHAQMMKNLQLLGGRIDAVFFCPHTPEDHCDCRKPLPGMALEGCRSATCTPQRSCSRPSTARPPMHLCA